MGLGILRRISPPLATFIFTLAAVAAISVLYARHVSNTDQPVADPNIQDWNSFLSHLNQVDICVSGDEDPTQVSIAKVMQQFNFSASVSMSATLKYTQGSVPSSSESVDGVSFEMDAKQFGVQGQRGGEPVKGFLSLKPFLEVHSECRNASAHQSLDTNCSERDSFQRTVIHANTCLWLFAPKSLILPHYWLKPDPCVIEESVDSNQWWKKAKVIGGSSECVLSSGGTTNDDPFASCVVHLQHRPNDTLSAFLSFGQRHLVNVHLMHCSYFLMALVALLLVVSLMRRNQSHLHPAKPVAKPIPENLFLDSDTHDYLSDS